MTTDPDITPTTEPGSIPEPEVLPSSTPDGPQTIPSPTTPEGEPGPDPVGDPVGGGASVPFDNRDSNPNSSGPAGLAGGMGVSSERTGPAADDPASAAGGIEGTGSKGGAVYRTDGGLDTSRTSFDAPDVSDSDMYPTRPAELDDTSGVEDQEGVDRTVGEPRPNPIDAERDLHVEEGGLSRNRH